MGAWQGCLGACYGLSPLPVKQKAISRLPRKALGIFGGSARDGLFPTGCPRKDNLIASTEGPWTPRRKSAGVLAMAFSPCPSREMLFQVSTRRGQDASQKCLGSSRPKITLIVNKCTLRLLLFGTGSNTCISAPGPGCPRRIREVPGSPRKVLGIFGGNARDGLCPLPVEEKAISRFPRKALRAIGGSARDDLS